MNPDEPTPQDEQCASLLSACHEALVAGQDDTPLANPALPPELRSRLERDLACVRLLGQVLSRKRAYPQGDSPLFVPGEPGLAASGLPATIGRFRVRRELGRGGFGIVFLAHDPQLGREVALKVPRAEAVLTSDLRQRFLREARAAAVLDHPNVVPVYDAGEVGPVCYIASAYCPGHALDAWLKARTEPVPWKAAVALVATLAEAVDHAHAHGVIHRDLKPANILLSMVGGQSSEAAAPGQRTTENGPLTTPRITDFGLAKLQGAELGGSTPAYQTQSGALVGTPRYMAPEQTLGKSQAVGPAADIHALGAILYEVVTGRPPFLAETALDTLELVRSHEPVPPSRLRLKLPRDLDTICLRCLHKEPHKRYAGARELAEDLRRLLHGKPILARPIRAWERAAKWAKRRPAVAALLALVVGVTALGFGLVTWQWQMAVAARSTSEQNLYFNRIALAQRELLLENWGRAEEILEQCDERWRDWEWHYLSRVRHAPPLTLPLGERRVMAEGFDLAFSPDSRLLALPSGENTIKVWEVADGARGARFILEGHTKWVLSVAFSPDGRRLASTSEDNTVMIWDLAASAKTGESLSPSLILRDHTDRVIGVTFSPDQGRLLATASNDRTVKLWNASTGELLFELPGQSIPNSYLHLAFSPDGRRLASGSENNAVRVWDVATGQEVFTLVGHAEPIFNVTFSPDGRRLVSAARDGDAKVWDLPSGEPGASAPGGRVLSPRYTLTEHSYGVWCVAFSPDGQSLAVGGVFSDDTVRIYEAATGRPILKLRGNNRVVSVAFNADGRRLASAGLDKTVLLWDTTTGHEILTLGGHTDMVGRVLFSPDGQRLASASADGTVQVWDASPFDEAADRRTTTLRGHGGEVYGLAFSPNGLRLASASADKSIIIWNTETGRPILTLRGHRHTVCSVAFSPDGLRLVSGSYDRTAKLWDAQNGKVVRTLDTFKGYVRSVAFSPDRHIIATASVQSLQLWDAETGQELPRRFPADPDHVHCVTFSCDGKYLAAVGTRKSAKVWKVDSGDEVCSFPGHLTRVRSVAFHPQGEYVASGDGDRRVKLWNAATGDEIDTLSGHSDVVESVAFSPDGRWLATASWREVIVWDARTRKSVQTLGRFAGTIWCVALSPDSKRLAAAGGYKGKGDIKIWDASLWEKESVIGP